MSFPPPACWPLQLAVSYASLFTASLPFAPFCTFLRHLFRHSHPSPSYVLLDVQMQTPPQLLKVESDPGEHYPLPFGNGTCTGRFQTIHDQG